MRILLRLRPLRSAPFVNDYHYHAQALLYSFFREEGLVGVHDKLGYKFFCFSNIFPFGNYVEGEDKCLLVSSPNMGLIQAVERGAMRRMNNREMVLVGKVPFVVSDVGRPFRLGASGFEVAVKTATPIVLRIPRWRYLEYGVKPDVEYEYLFWRSDVPLEAFVKQLRDNMMKKFKEYYAGDSDLNSVVEERLLPEIRYYRFLKSVAMPIRVKRQKQLVIGSLWQLGFSLNSKREQEVLEFAVDCGFGERNSLGFGFINLANTEKRIVSNIS